MSLCASGKRFPILRAMNSPVITRRGRTPEWLHERCLSATIGTSAVLSIGLLKSRMEMGERSALCASQSDDLAPSRPMACSAGSSRRLTSPAAARAPTGRLVPSRSRQRPKNSRRRTFTTPLRLILEIKVGKLLAIGVLHDEGFLTFLDRPGRKRRGGGMAR